MSIRRNFLARIAPKREEIVAEVGNVVLKRKIWSFEDATHKEGRLVSIRKQNLLPPHNSSMYLSIKEAEKTMHIKSHRIYRFIKSGDVEAIKVNNRWLVLKASLAALIKTAQKSDTNI